MGTVAAAVKEFTSEVPSDWCAGCGDFGVLNALFQTCAELKIQPHRLLVVSGIGCSSNLPGFIRAYGVHSLHGRALPVATGAKLANHGMTVIATAGDGDGYGIGLNHFIQGMRRNIDVTYIVMNNEVYGLTTGQTSPDERNRYEDQEHARGEPRGDAEPHLAGAGLGLWLCRPRIQRPTQTSDAAVPRGHPLSGLRADRCLQPLRDVQQGEHVPVVSGPGVQTGRGGPRPDRFSRRHGQGPRMGRQDPPAACSIGTRIRVPPWTPSIPR